MDVEYPVGKVLVELAQLQNEEIGDGTSSVAIAAELRKTADEFVKNKFHLTTIIKDLKEAGMYPQVCFRHCHQFSSQYFQEY